MGQPSVLESDLLHSFQQLNIDSISALLVNLGTLEFEAAWAVTHTGAIRRELPEWSVDSQFPGMVTTISRIALAPPEEMLAQCRSPRHWVFAWRLDDTHVAVAETYFRSDRDDMSHTDKTLLRILCGVNLRAKGIDAAAAVATQTQAKTTAETHRTSEPSGSQISRQYAVRFEIPATAETVTNPSQPAAPPAPPAPPAPVSPLPSIRTTKLDDEADMEVPLVESPIRSGTVAPPVANVDAWPASAYASRKTIAIPLGHEPLPYVKPTDVERSAHVPRSGMPEAKMRRPALAETPPNASASKRRSSTRKGGHGAAVGKPSRQRDRRELPRADSESMDWPLGQVKLSLISTLGLALTLVCTLLGLWVAAVAVPDTTAAYRADIERRRMISDQTMVRDLSAALATGDHGNVQAALSSFSSLGYFESALVSDPQLRVIALAGTDTGLHLGDSLPAEIKQYDRSIDLIHGSGKDGQLLLLKEPTLESTANKLKSIRIAAASAGGASFTVTLLILLRLLRGFIARLFLRGR